MTAALVTGASHGIGRAISIFLARRGYRIICVARSAGSLAETAKRASSEGGKAVAIAVDIGEPSGLDRVVSTVRRDFSDLSLIAHLATPRVDPEGESTLENTPLAQIEGYVSVTFGAAVFLTKELQPLLAKNAPSHLFFMASDWALRGSHGPAAFAAAKAGIAHFARSSRREMARHGIRTTILFPGDIASFDADWEEPVWDIDDDPKKVIDALGNTRILLSDVALLIGAALDLKTGRLEEIVLSPTDPEYDY